MRYVPRMANVWALVGIGALVTLAAFVLLPSPGPYALVLVCGTLIALAVYDARRKAR